MDFIAQDLPKEGDTVVVGMSGGVDSTLVTHMLIQKGCKVIGATMSVWDGSLPQGVNPDDLPPSCFGPGEAKNIEECKKFCEQMGIEYHVINVQKEYRECVLEYFKNEYRSGRTPNPCIRCNATVKFGAFLRGLSNANISFDYFCTGHYAKIVRPASPLWSDLDGNSSNARPYMIATAADVTKDQTYFLYRIAAETLQKVRFPLASLTKAEVFKLAEEAKLEAAKRKESQDFVGEEFFDLIFSDKPSVPGDIIDLDGKVLGRHRGIEHYTIGQRRGLGVSARYPVYVQAIDPVNNVVVLAPNEALNANALIADNFVWPGNIEPPKPFEAMVKIRLASKPTPALIEKAENDSWKITFKTPQRAIAPGQSAVIYQNGIIVGGGIIRNVVR